MHYAAQFLLPKLVMALLFTGLSMPGNTQEVKVLHSFDELQAIYTQRNDTAYVINFWATWCKPCVKELPHFETIVKENAGKKVKVLLVSLDFVNHLETKVKPFIRANNLQAEVLLLDDLDYNSWIDRVDATWSGAIPATLLVRNGGRYHDFYQKEFTLPELRAVVKALLQGE